MFYILITLIIIAIVLFILSFFMNDKIAELESQFDEFSMTSIQDTYQLNKKIKVLEEELLLPHSSNGSKQSSNERRQ